MEFTGKKQSKSRSRKSAADFKVVYISSPMKVKTSASKFRSLVQKLTGQDSDAESFMELIATASAAADRNNLQSSAFPDHQLLLGGDDDLIMDRDRRFVAGKIETAVAPAEELVLQNFDGSSFAELFHGFLHESSAQTEMPALSSLL